jgi:hypothetical protein
MIEVTTEQVYRTAREVVAEKPDYVYINPMGARAGDGANCYYVHGNEPGCVVGAVLHRLGVPLEELARFESTNGYIVSATLTNMEDRTASFLRKLQWYQDNGRNWLTALSDAEATFPEPIAA